NNSVKPRMDTARRTATEGQGRETAEYAEYAESLTQRPQRTPRNRGGGLSRGTKIVVGNARFLQRALQSSGAATKPENCHKRTQRAQRRLPQMDTDPPSREQKLRRTGGHG